MTRAIVIPLLLSAAAALAQETPAPATAANQTTLVRLTVDEAVARAIAASPRLARLSALGVAAEAQARGARAARWPQVEVGAGYTRRSEVPELAIFAPTDNPAQPVERIVVFPNIQDNWRLRAGAALPLYTGGRLSGQISAADHGRAAAGEDLRAGRADLVLETKRAYWSLVTARETERVLQQALRAYDAHLLDARNRERFGMAARNEVLAVEVECFRSELERLRAEAEADAADANLQRLLALDPATHVEPSEPLQAAPAPRPELEGLVAEAQAARPERRAIAARVAAADAAAGAERGARLPQLALSGGYTYANPNRDIVPPTVDWKDTWDIGVGLSWSVFDGGKRSASEARARAQADAVREQLRELDRAVRLEITERVLELRTAEARLAVAERSVVSAAESRRVAADRYREGVIPSSELLDAELAQERAELTRTQAHASLRLAAAGLDRAVGR
ncbi:MAG TPA: TolC family protein [Vicinamibacteria bacterium]|nr:TolC family protein [Vicinamibacteria bacterium]